MPMPTYEDDLETIGGHVDLVRDYCGEGWPDGAPADEGDNFADALAAWAGYANGRGMTAPELIKALGLDGVAIHCAVGALCNMNAHATRADCVCQCARCKPE